LKHKIKFSIIIPVYNDFNDLNLVMQAIDGQEYPRDLFEIIVVDNGSSQKIPDWLKSRKDIILLNEHMHISSPYSARNRGLEVASNGYIVFLDSTCIPVKNWLQSASLIFDQDLADLIGGNVKFKYSANPSAGEYYDSLINIRMKDNVLNKGVAKTANLFVKREVINQLGKFPEKIRSGGDILWTAKATESGFKIIYSEEALVYKKARTFKELIIKQWRVGKGHPRIWREQGKHKNTIKLIFGILIPPSYSNIKKMIQQDGNNQMIKKSKSIWLVAWFVKIITLTANIIGFYRK
jgi:glycosyltransferase AglE